MERVRRASSRVGKRISPLLQGWFGWIIFVVTAYVVSMYLTTGIVFVAARLGLFAGIDATNFALMTRIILYATLLFVMLAVPAWLKRRVTRSQIGLGRVMEWKDIGIGIAGAVVYLLLAMAALMLLQLVPGVNVSQAQELEIGQVYGVSRMMVFLVLVVITPFVEEVIFRGIFYGGLRARGLRIWVSALVVSLLFGLAHGQLNVGVDVFCLSLVACYARELTGSIWAGVVLHMIKNFVAFAVVFMINQG